MGVYFHDGGILFNSGKIAFHEDCCCDTADCGNCSSGFGPLQLEVTASGITNRECPNCAVFNGTHITSFLQACSWCKLVTGSEFCNEFIGVQAATILVTLVHPPGSDYLLNVIYGHTSPQSCIVFNYTALYRKVYVEKPDCFAFSSEVLDFVSSSFGPCNNWPATVTLSTI